MSKDTEKQKKSKVTDEMKSAALATLVENGVSKVNAEKLIVMAEKTYLDREVTLENFVATCLESRPFLLPKQPGGAVVMTPEMSQALDKKSNPTRFSDSEKA